MDEISSESRAQTASTAAENPSTATDGEKTSIDDALAKMNKNMSMMADILQKMYNQKDTVQTNQPLQGKCPTGNKRPREGSDDSEHESQSESDTSTIESVKKRRRRTNSDDDISLYAGDSADDVASLKSSFQTSQVANDNGREKHADGISQVLDDLAKSFGDESGDKSPDIQPKLAEIVTKRWGSKLPPEKLKGLIEKYHTPGNCPSLVCKKVNPQIWNTLSQGTKKADVHLYNLQETIVTAVFASLQTTSALLSKDLGADHTQLMAQAIDSLAMLAHAYAQLTQLRKNQIRPALKPEYSAICSLEENKESMFLFGDDLPKVLKEAKESSNISSSLKHHSKTYKRPSWSGKREQHSRSQQRDFPWGGQQKAPHTQAYKKKKPRKPFHEKK